MKCFDKLLTDFVAAVATGNLRIETVEQKRVVTVLAKEAIKRGLSINGFEELTHIESTEYGKQRRSEPVFI